MRERERVGLVKGGKKLNLDDFLYLLPSRGGEGGTATYMWSLFTYRRLLPFVDCDSRWLAKMPHGSGPGARRVNLHSCKGLTRAKPRRNLESSESICIIRADIIIAVETPKKSDLTILETHHVCMIDRCCMGMVV